MITFRGKVVQVDGHYFAEVVEPPEGGQYSARNRIELGLVPENLTGVQRFHVSDRKAYPADGHARPTTIQTEVSRADYSSSPKRWGWQKVALAKWERSNRIGIVEAVTGSGKTFLAMEAWRRAVERHKQTYTLVVVPSILLMRQWHDRLREKFPGTRIALLGGGNLGSFKDGRICVTVINSVVGVGRRAEEARLHELFDHCRRFPETNRSFLIADECHHYIHAEIFSRVRRLVRYDAVLALSATVGASYEVEGLGAIVHTHTFADAIRQGDMPPLTLLNVRCQLFPDERRKYEDLTEKIREQLSYVQRLFEEELEEVEMADDLWEKLKRIDRAAGPDGEPAIRLLMVLFFERAGVLYTARDKLHSAQRLIQALLHGGKRRKVIVFFERIASALESAEAIELRPAQTLQHVLATRELWTGVMHSGLEKTERERTVAEFRRASRGILFACRMLDEGFDVPDVDAAGAAGSIRCVTKPDEKRAGSFRLFLNQNHSAPTQFATLTHELAHLFLGHFGPDKKRHIPARPKLDHAQEELEAESVAYIVCARNNVETHSQSYLRKFVAQHTSVDSIDLYQVMRAAGQVEVVLKLAKSKPCVKPPEELLEPPKPTPQQMRFPVI